MKLNDPFVITISREVGSGGRTVGEKLAEKLNVNYVSKELIKALEEKLNLTQAGIEHLKGSKKNWFTDIFKQVAPEPKATIKVGGYTYSRDFQDPVTVQDVYDAEVEILNAIADEGSCVIAGRSAFFVLKDHPNKLNIFIQAPLEKRVRRVMEKQSLTEEEAREVIASVDKSRDTFVQRYAGVSRYDARNYDLVLNVGDLTDDEAVACILKYIKYSDK